MPVRPRMPAVRTMQAALLAAAPLVLLALAPAAASAAYAPPDRPGPSTPTSTPTPTRWSPPTSGPRRPPRRAAEAARSPTSPSSPVDPADLTEHLGIGIYDNTAYQLALDALSSRPGRSVPRRRDDLPEPSHARNRSEHLRRRLCQHGRLGREHRRRVSAHHGRAPARVLCQRHVPHRTHRGRAALQPSGGHARSPFAGHSGRRLAPAPDSQVLAPSGAPDPDGLRRGRPLDPWVHARRYPHRRAPVAQWTERRTSNPLAAGSNPAGGVRKVLQRRTFGGGRGRGLRAASEHPRRSARP